MMMALRLGMAETFKTLERRHHCPLRCACATATLTLYFALCTASQVNHRAAHTFLPSSPSSVQLLSSSICVLEIAILRHQRASFLSLVSRPRPRAPEAAIPYHTNDTRRKHPTTACLPSISSMTVRLTQRRHPPPTPTATGRL